MSKPYNLYRDADGEWRLNGWSVVDHRWIAINGKTYFITGVDDSTPKYPALKLLDGHHVQDYVQDSHFLRKTGCYQYSPCFVSGGSSAVDASMIIPKGSVFDQIEMGKDPEHLQPVSPIGETAVLSSEAGHNIMAPPAESDIATRPPCICYDAVTGSFSDLWGNPAVYDRDMQSFIVYEHHLDGQKAFYYGYSPEEGTWMYSAGLRTATVSRDNQGRYVYNFGKEGCEYRSRNSQKAEKLGNSVPPAAFKIKYPALLTRLFVWFVSR